MGVRFGHPALFKPLITPMVHAKARHLLSQVYRAHLPGDQSIDTDGASIAPSYTDIALETLSSTGELGKKSRGTRFAKLNPKKFFELVPESNLDFAFFKNRAEFGDEHGGDGELYGRPADLISDRGGTPKSFFAGGDLASESSRPTSPTPTLPGGGSMVFNPIPMRKAPPQGIYNLGNESERTLLSNAAAPMGASEGTPGEETPGEQYGVNSTKWRAGGGNAGYFGVPNPEVLEEEGLGYEAYRPRKE